MGVDEEGDVDERPDDAPPAGSKPGTRLAVVLQRTRPGRVSCVVCGNVGCEFCPRCPGALIRFSPALVHSSGTEDERARRSEAGSANDGYGSSKNAISISPPAGSGSGR
jgi:hypothetical protein